MEPRRYPFRAMGAPCQLALYGDGDTDRIAVEAVAEVERLESKYSRYRDDSVPAEINRAAGDPEGTLVDPETASLLDYAETGYRESEGLFDVTSGVLRRAWDFRSGRLPSDDEIAPLRALVGWHRVSWNQRRLILPIQGMEIDLGGFVKEYAADRVAALCRQQGISHGLVDLGGDIAIIGPHPDGTPWRVGIRHPRVPGTALAWIPLGQGAIASSGDYERFMVVEGRRYSHILDPRTGWPALGPVATSVVAPHCVVAGAAATIAMLKSAEQSRKWLAELGLPHLSVDRQLTVHGSLAGRTGLAGALPHSVAGEFVHG